MAKKSASKPPDPWPTWCSSIAQASAIMGIDKPIIRRAKAAGAPGFAGSRVNPRVVADWIHENDPVKSAPVSGAAPIRRDLKDEVADLDSMLAQVDALAKESMAGGGVTVALELLAQRKSLSDQRNAAMVQLRRQGRTEDDSVPRQEVERLAHALAYNAAVGLQRAASKICDALKGISDPIQMHPIVTDILICDAFIAPFDHACNLPAGHGVPSWLFESIKRGAEEFVE